MNIRNAIRAYFHGAASDRLAASVGLDNALTRKVLNVGLPLQLDMLAVHSSTPEGQTHILETIANLPRFTSVAEALSSHNGIVNLQQAGELLFPILLSNQGDELVQYVTGQVGGSLGSIQKLLHMTLPLMLSLLGQQGLDATNVATVFPQFKGQLDGFQVVDGNDVSGSRNVKNGASAAAVVLPNMPSTSTQASTPTTPTPTTPAETSAQKSAETPTQSTESTQPASTKPTTKPTPAESAPTQPAPTKPAPTQPAPAESAKPKEPTKTAEDKKPTQATQAAATTAAVGVAGAAAAASAVAALSPSSLIDLLKAQFGGDNAKKLGAFAGVDENKAEQAVQGAVPVVLSGLIHKAKTAEEADALLGKSLEVREFATEKGELSQLDSTEFLSKAENKGQGLLGHFHDNLDPIKEKLASVIGGNGAQAQKLLAVLSPLMLGVIGNRARAGKMDGAALSGVLGSLSGKLPALLPSGFSGLGALLGGATAAGVAGAAVAGAAKVAGQAKGAAGATVNAAADKATSAKTAVAGAVSGSGGTATPPPSSPPEEDHKRTELPWRLFLALIPLIILAGCLLGPKKDSSVAHGSDGTAGTHGGATDGDAAVGDDHDEDTEDTEEGTDTTDATTAEGSTDDATDGTDDDAAVSDDDSSDDSGTDGASAEPSETEFSVTTPEEAAEVPTGSFAVAGVGAVGATYKILRDGTEIGTVNADDEGKWESEINDEDALEGERTYIFEDEKGTEVTRLNVVANADLVEEANAEGADAEDADTDADATGESDEAPSVPVVVDSPAEGDEVPAEGFNVTGKGNPGDTYELLEDGVSVGTFTVAEDGSWTVDVPGTDAGEKNYVVARVDDGTELANFPLVVQAAVESGTCEKDLTMSLSDNENVTAPYRFGGVGNAETYSITVKRDDRVIGTKTVELGGNCVWGYLSDPGGASGSVNTITYEVRAKGTAKTEAPDTTITLNVKAR